MAASTDWFVESRFGMFVHWGLYSIPAGIWKDESVGGNFYAEWIQMKANAPNGIPLDEYKALAKVFNPLAFDADAWIGEAANAGMRYFLITSKHHDGFALWPTKVSDYNVVDATPFKRDILGELRDACETYGVKLGFYYSHWQDWEHPGGAKPAAGDDSPSHEQPTPEAFDAYWTEKCMPQVRELMENYTPAFFWFDNWRADESLTEDRLDRLIGMIRDIDDQCLINSRIGTTWNHAKKDVVVDYLSMDDNAFPTERIQRPWETSGTMNRSWGYHQLDFGWKPAGQLLRHLIDNASRGGNYQLNIGPKADGSVPAASIRRLREIGAWMAINGEALYGTEPVAFPEPAWGRATCRKLASGATRLYLLPYQQLPRYDVYTPGLELEVTGCRVLETEQELEFLASKDMVSITAPQGFSNSDTPVIVLDVKGSSPGVG